MRNSMLAGFIGVLCSIAAAQSSLAESQVVLARAGTTTWLPCDTKMSALGGCEIADFSRMQERDDGFTLVRAPKGFVFASHRQANGGHIVVTQGQLRIAGDGANGQDAIANVGDYAYIPARRLQSVSCQTDCMFYLKFDGTEAPAQREVKARRPHFVRQ